MRAVRLGRAHSWVSLLAVSGLLVSLTPAGSSAAVRDEPNSKIKVVSGSGTSKKPLPPAPPTPTPTAKTLVLHDASGEWGWMGEKYAVAAGNLASHFGSWTAKPVSMYTAGEMANYDAVIYMGSSWNEPIPESFLQDTLAERSRVVWANWNIWQLTESDPNFAARYGWKDGYLDQGDIPTVEYKGKAFTRYVEQRAVMDYSFLDRSKVTVLAEAVRADGYRFPWALRSNNLTYVGEIPFSYMSETDRYLVFSDLLFDALAPGTPERHRALVRLEDVGCDSDPRDLKAISDYLDGKNIPFSFGVYPVYKNPYGVDNGGVPQTIKLGDRECRPVRDAIAEMIGDGGTMLMHGYTHQFDGLAANPYNGKSGDDFEFFTAHVDEQDYVRYDGPVPGDSYEWALGRLDASAAEFKRARLNVPTIFEFPHYAGSSEDYRAVNTRFDVRYERSLYFDNVLRGGTVDHSRMMGQFFPYNVNDVYGTRVIPENIGNIETESYNHHPITLPAELIRRAELNLAVRDGFASFFYHPHLGVDLLRQTVEGIEGLGYRFVSPNNL
jgi:uncharacterized protein YdaL